jgi:hypothetical protein
MPRRPAPPPDSPALRDLRVRLETNRQLLARLAANAAQLREERAQLRRALAQEEGAIATERARRYVGTVDNVLSRLEQGIAPAIVAESLGLALDEVQAIVAEHQLTSRSRHSTDVEED